MYLFLFLAALGLCCSQVFLLAASGGCSSPWCRLACAEGCGIFQTRGPICVPHIGRWIPNHWPAVEVSITFLQRTFSVIVWSTGPCRYEARLFSPLHGGHGPEHRITTQHAAFRRSPCFCIWASAPGWVSKDRRGRPFEEATVATFESIYDSDCLLAGKLWQT